MIMDLFIRRWVEDKYIDTRDEELRGYHERSIIGIHAHMSNKAQMSAPKNDKGRK